MYDTQEEISIPALACEWRRLGFCSGHTRLPVAVSDRAQLLEAKANAEAATVSQATRKIFFRGACVEVKQVGQPLLKKNRRRQMIMSMPLQEEEKKPRQMVFIRSRSEIYC